MSTLLLHNYFQIDGLIKSFWWLLLTISLQFTIDIHSQLPNITTNYNLLQLIGNYWILPSGSRSLVTPYSLSITWKAKSILSRTCLLSSFFQSTRSGRFRWIMALKARPSLQDRVKSSTLTPGYRWVVFWAHRNNASLAETSSCPTTMSEIWKRESILNNPYVKNATFLIQSRAQS